MHQVFKFDPIGFVCKVGQDIDERMPPGKVRWIGVDALDAEPEAFLHRQAQFPHEGSDPFLPGGAEERAEQSHAALSAKVAMGSKYLYNFIQ